MKTLQVEWKFNTLAISDDDFQSRWIMINNEEEAIELIEWLEYYFNLRSEDGRKD